MNVWMAHIRNLESFLDSCPEALDVWEDGGVNGLVLGYLQFDQVEMIACGRRDAAFPRHGTERAAFDPNPQTYRDFGVPAPAPPPGGAADLALRGRLERTLTAILDRGWQLWFFNPFIGATLGSEADPAARMLTEHARAVQAARMVDTLAAFPMASGVIVDGPSWGNEIGPVEALGDAAASAKVIFNELPDSIRDDCERLGYSYDDLAQTRDAFSERLHQLDDWQPTPDQTMPRGDPFGISGMADWHAFRSQALTDFTGYIRAALAEHGPAGTKLAVCPRTPAIAQLAGYDYTRIAQHADVVMPKLYYWHRGFDGLVGTWWRWVSTLTEWNPGLGVADACRITASMVGNVPIVDSLADFDDVLTPEYLADLVRTEATTARELIGDNAQVVPWVDGGRAPHDGDPLTARHLRATLTAADDAGITQITYLNATDLSAAEWTTLSRHCGTTWDPRTTTWRPDDRPTR